ncbi:MAG: hypothetical protein COB67_07525, partial [SAR324 cluster bacterium]
MIIQCRHCNATYQIDPKKVPNKNAFVRCSKCSHSIPVASDEQIKVSSQRPQKLVHCDQCHVRYAIPLSHFKTPTINVRCGKCSFVFEVRKEDASEESPAKEIFENQLSSPEEDDNIQVDSLFDDITKEEVPEEFEDTDEFMQEFSDKTTSSTSMGDSAGEDSSDFFSEDEGSNEKPNFLDKLNQEEDNSPPDFLSDFTEEEEEEESTDFLGDLEKEEESTD